MLRDDLRDDPFYKLLHSMHMFDCPKGKTQSFMKIEPVPGLLLRCTASGHKDFVFESKLNGKTIRITIGNYDNRNGDEMPFEKAAYIANVYSDFVAKGIDPRSAMKPEKTPFWISSEDEQAAHTDIVTQIMNELHPHIERAIYKVLFERGHHAA